MGLSRQEYWSGLLCPLPDDIVDPGIKPQSLCLMRWHAEFLLLLLFYHQHHLRSSEALRSASEKAMAPHSSTLAWKIPWMEEPGGLQSMGSLSQTRLSDFTFTFHFHALEKEMATHSSVLAWRIPGTGEPGGLLSMGSHRVGHDWSDLAVAVGQHIWYFLGTWKTVLLEKCWEGARTSQSCDR